MADTLRDMMFLIERFEQDTGRYPSNLNELVQNAGIQGWDGPYLRKISLLDSWRQPILYSNDTHRIELRSAGRDRRLNTPDDVIRERFLHPTLNPAPPPASNVSGALPPQLNP
jgi:Type II secretion system (T2SS), protein G